jgi:uncharacterized protein (TIGR00369 family)
MSRFKPKDPQFETRVRDALGRQEAMRTLAIEIARLEPGEITLTMPYAAAYTQQQGFVHAGILATALDSACGGAAFSLMPDDAAILTVEFKLNLLAPARGDRFVFQAEVVKPGRTLTVCEAQAFAVSGRDDTREPYFNLVFAGMPKSEHVARLQLRLPAWACPHHPWKTLQGRKRLAAIFPFGRFGEPNMIARFAPGAP